MELDYQVINGQDVKSTADLVIAADGPSSTVRILPAPIIQRTYVGYVACRGTIREDMAPRSAKEVFVEKLADFHFRGNSNLSVSSPFCPPFLIPGRVFP